MPFEKKLPEWNNSGTEPPQSLKDSGWGVEQKPPADYFNWFFNRVYLALKELQETGASLHDLDTLNLAITHAMTQNDIKAKGYATTSEANAKDYTDTKFSQVKYPVTSVNNKTGAINLVAADVGAETPSGSQSKANTAESNAKSFASAAASAAESNAKAASAPLSHVGAGGLSAHPDATVTASGFMSPSMVNKLNGIAAGAEVNQNAFTTVKVGTVNIAADLKSDILELVAGTGITLTGDATNDKVSIAIDGTIETVSGAQAKVNAVQNNLNSHIGAGGSAHANATQAAAGFMSSTDKKKLDGVESGANNYTHPTTHPPSIIAQDANNRFVTDAEKTTWNAKASTAVATTTANGLMSSADKTKLDGIANNANNYVHPTGDGNQHIPATGTTNNKKVLKAGATAGSAAWGNVDFSEITGKPTSLAGYGITDASPSSHNHTVASLTDTDCNLPSIGDILIWDGNKWTDNYTPGWFKLTLQNGAVPYETGTDPSYCKIGNTVYIRGTFKGVTATGIVIATLPYYFRPAIDTSFVMPMSNTSSGNTRVARYTIRANGDILLESTLDGSVSSTLWFPLTVSFVVD